MHCEFTPRGRFTHWDERVQSGQWRRTGKDRRNHDCGQRDAAGAAIRPDRLVAPRFMQAATVRGLVRSLQANPGRRKQCPHQYDGNRRALEDASQHGLILPREPYFLVMWITILCRRTTASRILPWKR